MLKQNKQIKKHMRGLLANVAMTLEVFQAKRVDIKGQEGSPEKHLGD